MLLLELLWRRLPGPPAARLAVIVVLLSLLGASLWLEVFPWLVETLPLDDATVG